MTFSTRGKLFHFATTEFRSRSTPAGAQLMQILNECKAGNFAAASAFRRVFELSPSIDVIIDALTLFPYVTPRSLLLELADPIRHLLNSDSQSIEWLCIALTRSGMLDATRKAVLIYKDDVTVSSETDLPYHLSITLESSLSEVFYGPQLLPDSIDEYEPERREYAVSEYVEFVESKIEEVIRKFPNYYRKLFLYGKPIDIEELVIKLINTIAETYDNEDVVVGRSLIEAFTGVDLSNFYRNIQLDRKPATAALEQLLDDVDLSEFRPGVRYFFGREIPE
ncbi:hypothetical protein [Mesorhizobium sp. WSM4904]|uniref:hypothetical protein n=1 Tax=Mesorhizobium sp. WSM4904 TaxID=3038545 RepID=UPI0024184040|nr:hypothetical protein [Mesorhizobium sp. WSM4904]WFP62581.1 hypothetical protein QAZ47_29750 [Mesorhizobium sp. WSM4904]